MSSSLAEWSVIIFMLALPIWFVFQLIVAIFTYKPGSSSGAYHDEMRGRSSDMYDGGDGA